MGELIKLGAARDLVSAGAVKGAEVVGFPGGWLVRLRTGGRPRILATKLGEQRHFATVDSAVKVIRQVGLRTDALLVDASRWEPTGLLAGRQRPDRSAALKDAHAALRALQQGSARDGV